MIRLPSPVVCVEDAPVPEFVVNRTEVADLLAALVRPPPPRRRKPYDVGPGPHSHRDRWRARVNRLNDLAALTFDERGVRLPCGDVRAWRELPQGQPQRPALHAALARLCRCPIPEEATESFLAAELFPSHFADDATRGFDVTGAFESTGSDFGLIAHDGFEVTLTRNPCAVFGESVALSLARRGLVRTSTMRYLEVVADLAPGAWRMLESVARHWPHPRHMRDWLAWASLGAAQIEQAEQLARVAAERLRPFGINPPAATEKDEDGNVVPATKRTVKREDLLGHRKLQIHAREQLLAIWFPKNYGKKVGVEHTGTVSFDQALRKAIGDAPDGEEPGDG